MAAISKKITILAVLIAAVSAIAGIYFYCPDVFLLEMQAGPGNDARQPEVATKNNLLEVTKPAPYQAITSPVLAAGNSNFFETNTRIRIKDQSGNILADTSTNAAGWTDKLYPFLANVFYSAPSAPKGVVEIFESSAKDGSDQNKISIPVIFADYQSGSQKIKINLYYYNQAKDEELNPGIGCSRDAVLPVERDVLRTATPIQDAINLLLKGELAREEKEQGFSTEFPLNGFFLKGADLKDGVLTLEFADDNNKTTGGSCRASLLWAEIEKTAKQFSGVESVIFQPETLFQP